jgi:hypothetical protein
MPPFSLHPFVLHGTGLSNLYIEKPYAQIFVSPGVGIFHEWLWNH